MSPTLTLSPQKKSTIQFSTFLLRAWFFRSLSLREFRTLSHIKKAPVIRISSHYIMKGGTCVRLVEAQTMAFVREHTSIPVPCPRKVLIDTEGKMYIIMDYIDAPELRWSRLTKEEKASVMEQLRKYLEELRSINPPAGTGIEALDKGPLLDPRSGSTPFGPFSSFKDFFNKYCGYPVLYQETNPSVQERLARFLAKEHALIFTHGDIAPRNILMRDGKIVALLDWEGAGWFPEHWEITRALRSNLNIPDFWDNFRELFPGRFQDEIELEYDLAEKLFP